MRGCASQIGNVGIIDFISSVDADSVADEFNAIRVCTHTVGGLGNHSRQCGIDTAFDLLVTFTQCRPRRN